MYLHQRLSSKMPATVTVALLGLAPWVTQQWTVSVLLVVVLTKEPRQVWLLSLSLAFLLMTFIVNSSIPGKSQLLRHLFVIKSSWYLRKLCFHRYVDKPPVPILINLRSFWKFHTRSRQSIVRLLFTIILMIEVKMLMVRIFEEKALM